MAGRPTIRCRAKLAPSPERQTATAPGHGSAATASHCNTVPSPRAAAKSSTTAAGRPATGGGRLPVGAGGAPGVANTEGSTARVETRRVEPSRDTMEPRPGLGRHGQDVARLDRDPARRERERGALAPGPEILKPRIRQALRLGATGHDGRVGARFAPA